MMAKTSTYTRLELAERLGVGLTTVDRVIARGWLRACGRRGPAKTYRLVDARRAWQRQQRQTRPSPADTAVMIQHYTAIADDDRDRHRALVEEWILNTAWWPIWAEVIRWFAQRTAAWPRELAAVVGAADPEAAAALRWAEKSRYGWDEARMGPPPPPALRPQLDALAARLRTAPPIGRLARALTAVPVPRAPRRATTIEQARAQYRRARAEYREVRVATRRGHQRRADVIAAVGAAIKAHTLTWSQTYARDVVMLAGDARAARHALDVVRRQALAPLEGLPGYTPPRPRRRGQER